MSNFLQRLLTQNLATPHAVRPRLPGRFEPVDERAGPVSEPSAEAASAPRAVAGEPVASEQEPTRRIRSPVREPHRGRLTGEPERTGHEPVRRGAPDPVETRGDAPRARAAEPAPARPSRAPETPLDAPSTAPRGAQPEPGPLQETVRVASTRVRVKDSSPDPVDAALPAPFDATREPPSRPGLRPTRVRPAPHPADEVAGRADAHRSPQRETDADDASSPIIEVHIGRIEVRAIHETQPAPPPRTPAAPARLTLEEYARQRAQGER